ncbi:MAG: cyclic nucleotide-binding domain-containing protein [Frankiales bacterium]|nr:cyclic nucleotide-binding domain-containing protein [Frankiales bacterium]
MTSPDPADLALTPLFADLDDNGLRTVAGWLDVDEVDAGRHLTREGASGYAFFVLHAGRADVHVGDEVVTSLGPGDFFGELSMLGAGRRTATVTVTEPATVWTMFGTRFRELQLQHPEIAEAIERVALRRQP